MFVCVWLLESYNDIMQASLVLIGIRDRNVCNDGLWDNSYYEWLVGIAVRELIK